MFCGGYHWILISIWGSGVKVKPPTRPGIEWILVDEMGNVDAYRLNPGGTIHTPKLDRLAAGGHDPHRCPLSAVGSMVSGRRA